MRRFVALVLPPILCVALGCGGGGVTADANAPAGGPVAPEPAGPPPPLAVTLAEPISKTAAADGSVESRLARAAELATQLEPELAKISFDKTAPASLIVSGGGRQAEV